MARIVDLGPAIAVSFCIHGDLRWTQSPETITHWCDHNPVFPLHFPTIQLCRHSLCLSAPSPFCNSSALLRNYLKPVSENIYVEGHDKVSIFLRGFIFTSGFFSSFPFSQFLLLCGRPGSEKAVSIYELKIMTPHVALPSWKKEFCCVRQSARKDQAPLH